MASWNEDGNESNDDEDLEEEYKSIDDNIIFLIDSRKAMYENNVSGEVRFSHTKANIVIPFQLKCYLVNVLKLSLAVMKSKIVADDKFSIGIVFFGTVNDIFQLIKTLLIDILQKNKNKESDRSIENVFILFNLDDPTADRIKKIQVMCSI